MGNITSKKKKLKLPSSVIPSNPSNAISSKIAIGRGTISDLLILVYIFCCFYSFMK